MRGSFVWIILNEIQWVTIKKAGKFGVIAFANNLDEKLDFARWKYGVASGIKLKRYSRLSVEKK